MMLQLFGHIKGVMFPAVARHNQDKFHRERKRILNLQTLKECSLFCCNIGVLLEGSL